MANIHFSSNSAWERYKKCKEISREMGNRSLQACIDRLMSWGEFGTNIYIGTDYDELSFTFRETYPDGRSGVSGGIIFHGERDGFGSGNGPTFSFSMDKEEGYQIHT